MATNDVRLRDPTAFGGSGSTGTVAVTLGNDTSAASGTTTILGTSAATLGNDTSSATGTTTILGTSAVTLGNDTSSASGTTTVLGTLASTLGNDTSSASGTTTVVGLSAVTLGDDVSSASGSVGGGVSGTASITLGGDWSTASGTTPRSQSGSGGWGWRRPGKARRRDVGNEIEAERISLGISSEAAEVIARVALEQAQRKELADEVTSTRELLAALEASEIAWNRTFDEALTRFRQLFQAQEMIALLELGGIYEQQENDYNSAIYLLLMADP